MRVKLLKDTYHDESRGLYLPKGTEVNLLVEYDGICHVRYQGYNYIVNLKHEDYKPVQRENIKEVNVND